VDATGATGGELTSVWAVRLGRQDVQLVFGNRSTLQLSDFRTESITDKNGKKGPGEVADLMAWVGLQCAGVASVARIKNVHTANAKALDDKLMSSLLDKFPAGMGPHAIFMSRRSLRQLRDSRTVVLQGSGKTRPDQPAIAPLPADFDNVPIYATD